MSEIAATSPSRCDCRRRLNRDAVGVPVPGLGRWGDAWVWQQKRCRNIGYGSSAAGPGQMGMGGGTNLSALAAAPDFDRAFIEQMSQWYRSWYSTP